MVSTGVFWASADAVAQAQAQKPDTGRSVVPVKAASGQVSTARHDSQVDPRARQREVAQQPESRRLDQRVPCPSVGTNPDMGLLRKVAVVGIAKKVYDESRKPENQRRIKSAVANVQARRNGGASGTAKR